MLQNKHNELEYILKDSPFAICACDRNGSITFFNTEAIQLWGRSPIIAEDKWCGSWKIYYPNGEELAKSAYPLAKIIQQGSYGNEELVIYRPDGSQKVVFTYPRPILNGNKEIIGAYNTFIDITDRKKEEEKQGILSAIVESSNDAIISKTLNGIITSWNKGAQQIFGYEEQEIVGKPITTIIPIYKLDEEKLIIEQIRKGEKVDHFETIRVTKSGREIPISLTVSPVKDKSGKVIGASKIARDISDQLTAQSTIKRHTNNLETLNALGKSFSAKLNVQEILQQVTDATTRLTGALCGAFFYRTQKDEEEAALLYAVSGVSEGIFEKLEWRPGTQLFHAIAKGEGIVRIDDVRNDNRYGGHPPFYNLLPYHLPIVSYLVVPVVSISGETTGQLIFGHTEAAKFTQEQEDMMVSVASQAAVALDNSKLFEKVTALNAKKDEFIALASHELKTPLTTLKGYLQMMERNNPDTGNKVFLTKALNQLNKLNALVSDLLDISKIEAGKLFMNKEPFDLVKLIDDILETFQYANNSHAITLEKNIPHLVIQADKQRIEQVVLNLLTNAIKYSPDGKEVIVRIHAAERKGIVSVKDFGVGLTKEQQQKIFSRFYRVNGNHRVSGLGLGLYLTKEIVERHGGVINVYSEAGKGSEFSVSLPLNAD